MSSKWQGFATRKVGVGEGSSVLFLADLLPVSCSSRTYSFLHVIFVCGLFMANAGLK